jgi:hypothetical protein
LLQQHGRGDSVLLSVVVCELLKLVKTFYMYLQRIVKDVAVMVFSYTMLRLDFFFESVIVSADGRADSVLLSVVAV